MPLSTERLREIVTELVSRPGHEKVRVLMYELLVDGVGASSTEVAFEKRIPQVHGRIDALLGRTIFEFKSDLRRESKDAKEELTRYLSHRESETGQHYLGIATDGATLEPYELRGQVLRPLGTFIPSLSTPRTLTAWLSAAVAVSADLVPSPEIVERELGRMSLAWHVGREDLAAVWQEVSYRPEVALKRDLWARLLERVYGSGVDSDELFFQHTYLTTVAKTMATHVLGIPMPTPSDLLSGRPFTEAGVHGVVESDFFDWPLATPRGIDLVKRVSLQAARFRLRAVEADVLKGLYESLIDPEQRHELGEYYTPDWLASRICDTAIMRPLDQRVIDPACGSGTFLFHSVRRFLRAADEANLDANDYLGRCCQQVLGMDVHPVAAQIARVTYLLAIGEARLRRHPALSIPVYLGDALQWNTREFLADREVLIGVPNGPTLQFPMKVAGDPPFFDTVISKMLRLSEEDAPRDAISAWLRQERPSIDTPTIDILTQTYEQLTELHREKRDHIWGFVARNLVRPVWLSQPSQRADVILGNPPWLSYRFMSAEMQVRFREESMRRGIWAGGKVATHQDLSAYFFARCTELYLKDSGSIAFVMPYAAMNRQQYAGFRTGVFATRRGKRVDRPYSVVRFTAGWAFKDNVQPLFPVPSCVLFAQMQPVNGGCVLPNNISRASGALPRRDASSEQAAAALTWTAEAWPDLTQSEDFSPYRAAFKNGATVFPRLLFTVELVPPGPIGQDPAAPVVVSRRTRLEKPPWKDLAPLRGNIEAQFLRSLYLGESVAPFRLLTPALAVIPWDVRSNSMIDAASALREGYPHLGRWLSTAESEWARNRRETNGMTLYEQIDYYGKLTAQFPVPTLRVVFAASGTLPAAALLQDSSAVVEHSLYWLAPRDVQEGHYLCGILNSDHARSRVAESQARGQWGARHFDKLMLALPIPRYDNRASLHRQLAVLGERAVQVAAGVNNGEPEHFVRFRRRVRDALRDDGVGQSLEDVVGRLLS